jgi:ribonuclease HI
VATAARPSADGRTTIAAVLRWQGDGASRRVVRHVRRCERTPAAYRALLLGLWTARRKGARVVIVGTDDPDVESQVNGAAPPPTEAIGLYVQVRALRNAFETAPIVVLDPAGDRDSEAAVRAAATGGATGHIGYTDLPLWAAATS